MRRTADVDVPDEVGTPLRDRDDLLGDEEVPLLAGDRLLVLLVGAERGEEPVDVFHHERVEVGVLADQLAAQR